ICVNCLRLSFTSESLELLEGFTFWPKSMPRKPQLTRMRTTRNSERRELPTILDFLRDGARGARIHRASLRSIAWPVGLLLRTISGCFVTRGPRPEPRHSPLY